MKAYFLVSPYLSDIQKGIQVSHCAVEMAVNGSSAPHVYEFVEWGQDHKTMVVLNYGFNRKLVDHLWNFLYVSGSRYYGRFTERELNDLPTVGFVLNSDDVKMISQHRQSRAFKLSRELVCQPGFEKVKDDGTMSKRDWVEALVNLPPETTEMNPKDFLRAVSTLHPA